MTKFTSGMTDDAIVAEIYARTESIRKAQGLTQIDLAERIGITPKTYRTMKQGKCSLMIFIAVIRYLNLLENFEVLVPDPDMSPLEIGRKSLMPTQKRSRKSVRDALASRKKYKR